jgi:YbbR domain-containing protein
MKIIKMFRNFFRNIWKIIDRRIVTPLTKLVVVTSERFGNYSNKFEKWLSRSNTLLFLSLFIAIIVFVIVDQKVLLFSENSAEVLKSQPVNVTYNEEAYVVEGLPKTVDITLIGRKADLYFAKQSPSHDINVDLTGLKPGTHKVTIKYNQALPSLDYKVNPSVATVIIYPKISETKTLTYDMLNQDSLDSKLVVKDVMMENDKVVVKGAEHQLKEVATVKALIDVNNFVKQEVGITTLKDVPLKAYDERGNVVDVEIVPGKINVDVEIASPSKELPIKVIPKGTISFGLAISAIDLSETKVMVYGDEEILDKMKYVPLTVDVKGLKEDHKFKLELVKPSGVRYMSVNNVTVDVKLDQSSDKVINNVNIETRNLSESLAVQGLSAEDTKVSVTAKGVSSVINDIKAEDITAYLDLKGFGVGVHEVEVQVEGSDTRVQYVPKTKKVKIRIVKQS